MNDSPHIAAALTATWKEYEEQARRVAQIRRDLEHESRKLERLRRILGGLHELSENTEDAQPLFSELQAAHRHIIEIMLDDPQRTWRVQQIQEELESRGFSYTERYAANTLRRLADRGHVIKVDRGRYCLSPQRYAKALGADDDIE